MDDNEFNELLKEAGDRASMSMKALRGISRAKPGSVRRLVEAAKQAEITMSLMGNKCADEMHKALRAALAEIELDQEAAK